MTENFHTWKILITIEIHKVGTVSKRDDLVPSEGLLVQLPAIQVSGFSTKCDQFFWGRMNSNRVVKVRFCCSHLLQLQGPAAFHHIRFPAYEFQPPAKRKEKNFCLHNCMSQFLAVNLLLGMCTQAHTHLYTSDFFISHEDTWYLKTSKKNLHL